jgi:diacylglycerol kinase (ATP)
MLENIHSALLIYNLACGRRRHTRFAEIEEATRILKNDGIAAELAPTSSRGAATDIARQAAARNAELVIVCGGDGTINEAINGLAGSRVPMAILPAGTANILAKELGIPWDISAAARLIRSGTARRIALGSVMSSTPQGEVDPSQGCRYFLSVAGAGPDGAIVHAVDLGLKDQTGILAYWAAGGAAARSVPISRDGDCFARWEPKCHAYRRWPHRKLRRTVQNHHRCEPLR